MYSLNARNVNEALVLGTQLLLQEHRAVSPRGKTTWEAVGPVATTYQSPMERVLFSPARDANPWLHLMDALYLLAGRNDVRSLEQYSKNLRQFSDDGFTFYGAYGHRLGLDTASHYQGLNQVEALVELLQEDPDSRRGVLAMWSPDKDLLPPDGGLYTNRADLPCNTHIYVKLREGKVDITVCCRSNDMLWGAYGANAVQFSVLQEYLAYRLNCQMGSYTQLSDSFHVYIDRPDWGRVVEEVLNVFIVDRYHTAIPPINPTPLFKQTDDLQDVKEDLHTVFQSDSLGFKTPFFQSTMFPMLCAWDAYKQGNLDKAQECAQRIEGQDWSWACTRWIERRQHNRMLKEDAHGR